MIGHLVDQVLPAVQQCPVESANGVGWPGLGARVGGQVFSAVGEYDIRETPV